MELRSIIFLVTLHLLNGLSKGQLSYSNMNQKNLKLEQAAFFPWGPDKSLGLNVEWQDALPAGLSAKPGMLLKAAEIPVKVKDGRLMAYDATANLLQVFDLENQSSFSIPTNGPLIDFQYQTGGLAMLAEGKLSYASLNAKFLWERKIDTDLLQGKPKIFCSPSKIILASEERLGIFNLLDGSLYESIQLDFKAIQWFQASPNMLRGIYFDPKENLRGVATFDIKASQTEYQILSKGDFGLLATAFAADDENCLWFMTNPSHSDGHALVRMKPGTDYRDEMPFWQMVVDDEGQACLGSIQDGKFQIRQFRKSGTSTSILPIAHPIERILLSGMSEENVHLDLLESYPSWKARIAMNTQGQTQEIQLEKGTKISACQRPSTWHIDKGRLYIPVSNPSGLHIFALFLN